MLLYLYCTIFSIFNPAFGCRACRLRQSTRWRSISLCTHHSAAEIQGATRSRQHGNSRPIWKERAPQPQATTGKELSCSREFQCPHSASPLSCYIEFVGRWLHGLMIRKLCTSQVFKQLGNISNKDVTHKKINNTNDKNVTTHERIYCKYHVTDSTRTADGLSPLLVRPLGTVFRTLSVIRTPPKLLSGAC